MKQGSLLVITILLLVTSYFLVKYLFKHFYLQRLLRAIGGNKVISDAVWKEWQNCQKTSFKGKAGQDAKQTPGMGQGLTPGMSQSM